MVDAVTPYPAVTTKIFAGGTPVIAIFGGVQGGRIINPFNPEDQGISTVEPLYYSFVEDAETAETSNTFPLQPGQWVDIPPGLDHHVSVNAATTGHRFSAYVLQKKPVFPPTPVPGTFPPLAPTSLAKTIPSYLYEQYADDDDLQAFVAAYNEEMQAYIDWFNQIGLPVYTGSLISGTLLDWVAEGLYGIKRPVLSSGLTDYIGPYNTAMFNQIVYNGLDTAGPTNVTVTNDDIFKRIMTWRLYRGDGKTFNLNWLKRRIVRFLNGPNGTDPIITNTYAVSAFYATRTQVDIVLPADPNASILKDAIDSGVLDLPFQLSFSVTISS